MSMKYLKVLEKMNQMFQISICLLLILIDYFKHPFILDHNSLITILITILNPKSNVCYG